MHRIALGTIDAFLRIATRRLARNTPRLGAIGCRGIVEFVNDVPVRLPRCGGRTSDLTALIQGPIPLTIVLTRHAGIQLNLELVRKPIAMLHIETVVIR